MQNLLSQAYDLLRQDERLISTDWELLKNKIQELAYKLDEKLIEILLSDATMKEKFFISIKDVVVFDQKKFVQFISNKQFLPDSYTAFKNKIGLTDSRDLFVSESNDVVLDRPYKDCVLAGGQDKEDAKRDEIFYNEVLWSDQIDRLLDPKVFTNIKKYTVDGEKTLDEFRKDENWLIKDNLIIKGNNLLALHSLKKQFAGKVKLIYIDPPYNTGKDWFRYNDKFNHSSRLVFMRNRLKIAQELLKRDDGVIFVQCDDNEQAYLKVLMDEIWGRDNFVQNFMRLHWKWKKDKNSRTLQQYALCYANHKATLESWTDFAMPKWSFSNPDNDPRWDWFSGSISFSEDRSNQSHDNYYSITSPSWIKRERQRQCDEDEMLEFLKNDKIYFWNFPEFSNVPRLKIFPDDTQEVIPQNIFDWVWTTKSALKELKILWFNIKDFDTPKPEHLMKKIIEISTQNWDIVLDYHLWSWTTCAIAHKMGRQYIGVEQMDYIETIAVERMKKVIEWEQWWISKSVDRKWWWEFIYMEIAQNNEKLIQAIHNAEYSQDLISLYHQIKDSSFINYKIDIKTIDANISEFENLSLEDMKRFLSELIDKNALYINYSEINDASYSISEEDKALNKKFYQ